MKKTRRAKPARAARKEPRHETPASRPEQLVQIEKPIYGGAFLARLEGKAVFVPLTLPGETARVRITDEKHGYSTAEVSEIVTPAPERIAPGCRYFGACGGCQYQHAGYASQIAMKQAILRETLERGGVRTPGEMALLAAHESQAWGYRNRIRLAFDSQGNPGYRGRRSNAIVPIAECPIAAPLLVRAAIAFSETARTFLPALHPKEISIFCDAEEKSLLASIFASKARKDRFDEFARKLAERIPELKGAELIVVGRDGAEDPTQASRTVTQWGDSSLTYYAAGFNYRVDHGAFFQVNRWLVDALVDEVTADARGAVAWDLFAGVGLFARKLTDSFDCVVAVESAPAAVRPLAENFCGTCGKAVRATTLDFLRGLDFLRSGNKSEKPDLIVVDPPRAGLGAEITERLGQIGAPALIYVSCDPATLARDLRALLACGYAIENITLADLFPQTFHLETVTRLRRS